MKSLRKQGRPEDGPPVQSDHVIRRRKFVGRMGDPAILSKPAAFTEAEHCG